MNQLYFSRNFKWFIIITSLGKPWPILSSTIIDLSFSGVPKRLFHGKKESSYSKIPSSFPTMWSIGIFILLMYKWDSISFLLFCNINPPTKIEAEDILFSIAKRIFEKMVGKKQ